MMNFSGGILRVRGPNPPQHNPSAKFTISTQDTAQQQDSPNPRSQLRHQVTPCFERYNTLLYRKWLWMLADIKDVI